MVYMDKAVDMILPDVRSRVRRSTGWGYTVTVVGVNKGFTGKRVLSVNRFCESGCIL